MTDKPQKKIYLAKCGLTHKIGVSENPEERIKGMQTGCPELIELIEVFNSRTPETTESRLHKCFKELQVRGEWFNQSDKLINSLRTDIAWYGVDALAESILRMGTTAYFMIKTLENRVNSLKDGLKK